MVRLVALSGPSVDGSEVCAAAFVELSCMAPTDARPPWSMRPMADGMALVTDNRKQAVDYHLRVTRDDVCCSSMKRSNQVLLMWDMGEGADLYALTVTAKEFKELKSINDLFQNSNLPEDLGPAWDRVNAALSDSAEYVPDHAKDCVGNWTDCKAKPGDALLLGGSWTLIITGCAP